MMPLLYPASVDPLTHALDAALRQLAHRHQDHDPAWAAWAVLDAARRQGLAVPRGVLTLLHAGRTSEAADAIREAKGQGRAAA